MTPANIKNNHLEYDYKDKSDVSRIDSQDEVSSGLEGRIVKPSTGDEVLKAPTDDGSHQFNSGVIVTR